MSSTALALVLASAFFHALWNALVKREQDSEAAAVAVLGISALLGCVWAASLRVNPFPTREAWAYALGAGVFEALYFTSLGKALQRAPLGSVYTTARGGAMLLVWPVSVLWMGETVRWLSAVGTLVLGLGLWRTGQSTHNSTESRGLTWAWICAGSIGSYHLCQKLALAHGTAPPGLFAFSLGLAFPLNLLRGGRAGLKGLGQALRRSPGALVTAGILATLSFGLLLGSLQTEGAGIVLTLRNTSILFAVALGLAQGEAPEAQRLQGAALVLIGAVLLGWPS